MKHFLFCVEPQEADVGACEAEVSITLLALDPWFTCTSWYSASPLDYVHNVALIQQTKNHSFSIEI